MTSSKSRSLFVPVAQRPNLVEEIASQLIHNIMGARYHPGDRLPSEIELAKQFGAGRGAVREALKALGVIGLVQVRRGTGTFVNERTSFLLLPIFLGLDPASDLESLIEARSLIEVEIAALAAERATADEIRSIESDFIQMGNSIKGGNLAEFLHHDAEFHFAIAHACHNPLLCQCVMLIRNSMQQWISLTVDSVRVAQEAQHQHRQILETIQSRSPAGARRVMRNHLEMAASRWLAARHK